VSIETTQEEIKKGQKPFLEAILEISQVVLGQEELIKKLFIALLAGGHVLIEGLPGLAKTLTAHTFSQVIGCDFSRVQFTPDLLPADLTGTSIYNPKEALFSIHKGPVFTNIFLADEINRAPPKVQSALLEVMQEKQVTMGGKTFKVGHPFIVLATQNPIELEGTYPLPEAQTDRFLMKVLMDYPAKKDELQLLEVVNTLSYAPKVQVILTPQEVSEAKKLVESIYVDKKVIYYIYSILQATRSPKSLGINALEGMLLFGASPRAGVALKKAAQAHAFFEGRAFVTPDDVKKVGLDVLRHRLKCTYEAKAEGISADKIVEMIFSSLEVI
jgi:MoxR-like ATPase